MATTIAAPETEKPEITKQSFVRRISYGICGICGPKVEIAAVNNDHLPASRPSKGPPTSSQGSKKRKKPPANISLQGQAQVSPFASPRSPEVVSPINYYDNSLEIENVYPSGIGQSNYSGAGISHSDSGWGENPQYEFITPANNFSWNHPSQATGVLGQIPWQTQSKDDEAMVRLFKNVDGRITDHILNFYIAQNGVPYQVDLGNIPVKDRNFFEGIIQDWPHLLSKSESRISLLRAIISTQVLRNEAFKASCSHGNNYDMISQIAKSTCDLLSPFALNNGPRLESMQALVSVAAEMHSTIVAQPTRFEVSWQKPQLELDTRTMEAVQNSDQMSGRVRATVFPGLLKHDKNVSLLAKAQVLLY